MLALLCHPEQLERLRAAPLLIDTAVEELLRFDSPAQLISRTATVDFELRGKPIRAGDSVLAAIGAANRDPERFTTPDRLDLARSPNPHLAFGLRTHVCPGAQLSRIEARAAIPALLGRFPAIGLGRTPHVRRRTAVLRGLEHLPVRLVRPRGANWPVLRDHGRRALKIGRRHPRAALPRRSPAAPNPPAGPRRRPQPPPRPRSVRHRARRTAGRR